MNFCDLGRFWRKTRFLYFPRLPHEFFLFPFLLPLQKKTAVSEQIESLLSILSDSGLCISAGRRSAGLDRDAHVTESRQGFHVNRNGHCHTIRSRRGSCLRQSGECNRRERVLPQPPPTDRIRVLALTFCTELIGWIQSYSPNKNILSFVPLRDEKNNNCFFNLKFFSKFANEKRRFVHSYYPHEGP